MASLLDPKNEKNVKQNLAILGGCTFLLSKCKTKSIIILDCLPSQNDLVAKLLHRRVVACPH